MYKTRSFYFNQNEYNMSSFSNLNVIIGRANTGPKYVPIFPNLLKDSSTETVKKLFGPDSELTHAFLEAWDGTSNFCLINRSGHYARLKLGNIITFESLGVDSDYGPNGDKKITLFYNEEKKVISFGVGKNATVSDCRVEYSVANRTISSLVNEINNDALLGISPVVAESLANEAVTSTLNLMQYLDGLALKTVRHEFKVEEDELENYYADQNLWIELEDLSIKTISILDRSFDEYEKDWFFVKKIKAGDKINYAVDVGDFQINICVKAFINKPYVDVKSGDKVYIGDKVFYVIEAKNNVLYMYDESVPFKVESVIEKYTDNGVLDKDGAIKELLPDLEQLNTFKYAYTAKTLTYLQSCRNVKRLSKLGKTCLINIGLKNDDKYFEETTEAKEGIYNRCLFLREKILDQSFDALSPFVNIVLSRYKTIMYSSDHNVYGNGIGLLIKAINNVKNFDNIIGYESNMEGYILNATRTISPSFFTENIELFSPDERKEEVSSWGFITTCVYKNKLKINSGKNLTCFKNKELGIVGNAILAQTLSNSISAVLNLEMSDALIENAISRVIQNNYSDVISSYKIDISSVIEQTQTVCKEVTLDIWLYGHIRSITLTIGVT